MTKAKEFSSKNWLVTLLMLVAAMVVPSAAWAQNTITPKQPSNGDGSESSPYQIGTAAELYWFAGLVNGDASVCDYDADSNPTGTQQNRAANAILTANITVNSGVLKADGSIADDASGFTAWTPIGFNYQNYTGTFDGKGYTVSGLYFNDTNKEKVGLFGRVDSGGKISNVGVLDSYFEFRMQGGGICGLNYGEINNCTNGGTVIGNSTGSGAGGVCGMNYGTVKDCENTGSVSGTVSNIGGVCGAFYSGTIENCLNEGTVSGTGETSKSAYGGVCGHAYGGVIKLSSNTASVSGNNAVGGVCGYNQGATLEDCYNTGAVVGTALSSFGGVCGSNSSGYTIKNCYNTGAVSGKNNVGGVCGENSGIITNCYYISGTATGGINGEDATGSAESKDPNQFMSGEVCYLLNNGKTDGSQAWYQNLSSEIGDAYPVLKSTEGNTVYGGYQHGETTIHYSNSASDYPHAHAYDSSASDEANGNHDKSYQGVFNWVDNADKTNATVTATFTCAVCGKTVTPNMTAVLDKEHSNATASCTEKAQNTYTTSYAFAGATFTDTYVQVVTPALRHNMNEITFNKGEKIYSNQCQREGCGYIGYYATSDGSVKATYEDGVYKVDFFGLDDGLAYDNEAKFTVKDFLYTRTFSHDKWVAVYVPFAIDCSQLQNDKRVEMAVINNFHEYEQTDGSYNVVLEVKRKTSGTIPALTPCVMRSMSAPVGGTVTHYINLFNAVFSPAADKYIDCSSVTRYYKFTGSLAGIEKYIFNEVTDFVLNEGTLYKANHETTLKAQRWYLSAEDRAVSNHASVASLRSIAIQVVGESDVTGIEDIHVVTEKATSAREGIFDLQGRKLNSEPSEGVYIKNGIKYVK